LAENAEELRQSKLALRRSQREARKASVTLEQQAAELERLTGSNDALRKKNYNLRLTLKSLEADIAKERTTNRTNSRLLKSLESRCEGYAQVDIALKWLAQGLSDETEIFSGPIATIGSDPFPAEELDRSLIAKGFDVYWPGDGEENEHTEVMIVGRSDWDEERLEQQLAAREGQSLRVYSQEMFLLSFLMSRDLLADLSHAELVELAADHPALKFLAESELEWPRHVVPALPTEFRPFDTDSRADESPLHAMGYAVGKTHGVPEHERRRLLVKAFSGNIPWVESDEYMKDWGKPRTRRRLWRMSNHVGWLARSWRRLPSHRVAVNDWTSDLDFLKREYYRPWMRFKWPEVRVPAN
jgi:hypothetical protein